MIDVLLFVTSSCGKTVEYRQISSEDNNSHFLCRQEFSDSDQCGSIIHIESSTDASRRTATDFITSVSMKMKRKSSRLFFDRSSESRN